MGGVVAERFHEGLIGHAQVLVTAAGQHQGTVAVDASGQLGGQAGLADPRLAGQECHPPLARRRLLPEAGTALQLVVPAHEDPPGSGEE